MATIVLVHGSFTGGWCWSQVAHALRAAGHHVHTPTLTGLGERAHLATPSTGLLTHIDDVSAVLRWRELSDVMLVGHSYAGMVITGVADRERHRIASLVYIDAFVPSAGQSCADLLPWIGEQFSAAAGDGFLVPPLPPEAFAVTSPEWLARCAALMTPMPVATHREPSPAGPPTLPATYVHCARQPFFDAVADQMRAAGMPIRHLDTGHMPMMSAPAETAELLGELASRVRA